MSCVFSLVLPDCCYVVADTRINLAAINGESGINDDRPQDLVYPDRTEERIGMAYRKLRRTSFGWAAGAGAFLLVYPLLRRLESLNNPEKIPLAIATVQKEQLSHLRSVAPHLAATLNRTAVLYTYFQRNRFHLQAYDLRTHTGLPEGSSMLLLIRLGFRRTSMRLFTVVLNVNSHLKVLKLLSSRTCGSWRTSFRTSTGWGRCCTSWGTPSTAAGTSPRACPTCCGPSRTS